MKYADIDIRRGVLAPLFRRFFYFVFENTKIHVEFLNVPTELDSGCILVINHTTRIETPIIPLALFKQQGVLSYSLMHGSFFINRAVSWFNRRILLCISTKDDLKYAKMMKALIDNHNVIIYPQGGIGKDGDKLPSRTGAAYLAVLLKDRYPTKDINIIPCRVAYNPINHTGSWLSRLTGLAPMEANCLINPTKLSVMMGRPIEIDNVPESERLDYIYRIRDRYHNFITNKTYSSIGEWRIDNPLTKNEIAKEKAIVDTWIADNPGRSTTIQEDYRNAK